jgi:hypothetical protein
MIKFPGIWIFLLGGKKRKEKRKKKMQWKK